MQPPSRRVAEKCAEKRKKANSFLSPLRLPRRLGVSAVAFLFAVLTSSLAQADLRTYTTNHYRIQTDVDPFLAEDLAHRMDAMFDEYSRRLVDFSPQESSRLFDVYIFQHHGQYLNFTNNRVANSGGVFMPGRALAAYLEGQGNDALRQTLQHEAFHQFAYSAIGAHIPVWLNEGLAQVFEEGTYNGSTFRIGEVPPRRVRELHDDIEQHRLFEFRSFMALSDKQWAQNLSSDRELGNREYNQAWAMTHYLIYSPDAMGPPHFRERLINMLRRIHDGADGTDAFVASFSDNIAGFQQMFLSYARELQPTETATYVEHQNILADVMIDLYGHRRTFNDIESLRREIEHHPYHVTYNRGSVQTQSDVNVSVCFHDLEGRELRGQDLYLEPRNGSPLPDIISRPTDTLQLHTRFSQIGGKIEHETVAEPPGR